MKTLINWISFQLYFLHYNMDRQAFKQRMQQLKQYREQNPGKTYLDFKKYADGGETGEKDWYNSLTKQQTYNS